MRDILFRGKRLDNGEWIFGTMYRIARDLDPFIMLENKHGCSYPVDEETVGQYTGLKDKNGKRIFEGDIVRCVSKTDIANMVVIFEDGEFRMVLCGKYKEYICTRRRKHRRRCRNFGY